ncbi:MAG: PEP-CTERM sorting domain-containing protein [Myxococcota bacterium]
MGLVLEQFPDVLVGNMDVSYDAATDTLSLDGFALELDDDGVGTALPITSGSFDLVATIDGAGNLSAGSLTIGGTVPDIGANSGTLLIGTLDSFGFPDAGGDPIELTFSITGGDLAPLYGAGPGGIIVGDSGFGGSFASDWDNLIASTPGTGFGVADVAPVPEPGTLSLLGASLAGIAWLGRRRGPATAA